MIFLKVCLSQVLHLFCLPNKFRFADRIEAAFFCKIPAPVRCENDRPGRLPIRGVLRLICGAKRLFIPLSPPLQDFYQRFEVARHGDVACGYGG